MLRIGYFARIGQVTIETLRYYDVVLKTVASLLVAGRRICVTENTDYPVGLPEAFQKLYAYAATERAEPASCGIAVWYTPVDATDEDVEAAVTLNARLPSTSWSMNCQRRT